MKLRSQHSCLGIEALDFLLVFGKKDSDDIKIVFPLYEAKLLESSGKCSRYPAADQKRCSSEKSC